MEQRPASREHRTDERLLVPSELVTGRAAAADRELRDEAERELDAFSASVTEERGRLDGSYAQAVEAVHQAERDGHDPLSHPAVRKAYLELQGLHGQLESATETARNEASRIRSKLN